MQKKLVIFPRNETDPRKILPSQQKRNQRSCPSNVSVIASQKFLGKRTRDEASEAPDRGRRQRGFLFILRIAFSLC